MSDKITAGGDASAPDADAGAGSGGIFDALPPEESAPAPGAAPGDKPARPAWLGEQFWDPAKNEPRLESLAKSHADLRSRIARGEGTLPADPAGYVLPSIEGIAPDAVPADDPLWGEIRTAAHKAGITQAQMEAITRPYLSAVAKETQRANAAPAEEEKLREAALLAEIEKLGPNGVRIVRDTGAWIAGLQARGTLSPEEAGALRSISDAAGIRAVLKLRELGGERAIPTDSIDGGMATQADARRMLVEGFSKNDDAMIERGRSALRELDRKGLLKSE